MVRYFGWVSRRSRRRVARAKNSARWKQQINIGRYICIKIVTEESWLHSWRQAWLIEKATRGFPNMLQERRI